MKRYTDFTQAEMAELTNEQLERLIDLEIAFAGIFPVEYPLPPEKFTPAITPVDTAFEVYGILFKTLADAEAVAKMEAFKADYDYYSGEGSNYKYLVLSEDNGVTKKSFYTKNDVKSIKAELAAYAAKKEKYDKDVKEYQKYNDSISSLREAVNTAYCSAVEFKHQVEKAKQMYQKYLDLAEGDEKVAQNFFYDAYKDRPDTQVEVLGKALYREEEVAND